MTSSEVKNSGTLLSVTPLLITESQEEFASLCAQLEKEIQPNGVVERTYVHDIANHIWETQRIRRYKAIIINNSRLDALEKILKQLLRHQDYDLYENLQNAAEDLARGWFENNKTKTKVATLLRKFGLDEGAIEAEAFRSCAGTVEQIDRMLTALQVRSEKALRFIAEYRQILSKQLRQAADQILDNDDVPRLISVGNRPV